MLPFRDNGLMTYAQPITLGVGQWVLAATKSPRQRARGDGSQHDPDLSWDLGQIELSYDLGSSSNWSLMAPLKDYFVG